MPLQQHHSKQQQTESSRINSTNAEAFQDHQSHDILHTILYMIIRENEHTLLCTRIAPDTHVEVIHFACTKSFLNRFSNWNWPNSKPKSWTSSILNEALSNGKKPVAISGPETFNPHENDYPGTVLN